MGKSKDNKKDWKELNPEGVTQFKSILNAITKFQAFILRSDTTKGSPRDFKRDLLKAKECRIYVRQTEDKHVFQIYAEILEKTNVSKDRFLFIDGILEAREVFEKEGDLTHPVFKINCLSDIYRNHSF
ncbi:LIC_13246 family protein [Leptospira santarosai]|uniref:LIC_13246 family protein n=1 Tax=Leptospira santarosai TaxID=28183 RepID=UPI00095CA28D|nr:hypothetical protein [Leptospira santarosai]OLY63634.1 hypothetical protein BWD11_13370 [Leptospira santarosai serovar Grippotyphosa]ONF76681.1 hypothetical protein BWD12_17775 [Leptospira santarosai serovar Bananal]ONF84546.1 hypothetical protein BWD13_15700 [Leptospira santarosai serovar Grippotyphosa]